MTILAGRHFKYWPVSWMGSSDLGLVSLFFLHTLIQAVLHVGKGNLVRRFSHCLLRLVVLANLELLFRSVGASFLRLVEPILFIELLVGPFQRIRFSSSNLRQFKSRAPVSLFSSFRRIWLDLLNLVRGAAALHLAVLA